ncbi:MAG: hypothetical protein IKU97_07560, partial [Tidjanibacter sp.]|nr:hypothetical protein [Tidjanibacter sp.]
AWNLVSAVNKKLICWCRENTAGPIICTKEYHDDDANGISGKFVADWTFFDVEGKGMQARTSSGAEKNRHLLYNATENKWKNGEATDAIVLVKLSDSTEQIAAE